MDYFLSVLGMVFIIEGLPYFCFPKNIKDISKKLPEMPNSQIRGIGLFLMVLGLAVIYAGRT